jgi:molybdate transport system regulatory protein
MTRPALRPRVKVWFEAGDGFGFGSGFVAILQAVEREGSIKLAAQGLGRSYRHIWDRIKRAETALGCPLVATQVGGQGPQRSHLTDEARALVAEFLALRDRMIAVMEAEFDRDA